MPLCLACVFDAFGNIVDEAYDNGVQTVRVHDPETGRLTDIDTTRGSTTFQDNEYAWRSNGTLESRLANPVDGIASTREETFGYDVLNRVTLAETYINSLNTRDLLYFYDDLGNITSKTSSLSGDTDVTGYGYGAGTAGPHAVTSATVDSTAWTLYYDDNGAVTEYDFAGTDDDRFIEYNAFNQPTRIVIGDSIDDPTPVVVEEFAYGPGGQRYARKSTWTDGANTYTEEVRYIGSSEYIEDNSHATIQTITKNRISPNVMLVEIVGTTTETFFEYAHRDHLGSIEVITDENGNTIDNLAFETFGARKAMDWTSNISSTELDDLLELDVDHPRRARGFTNHEHLDRTGLVHMNGRVYDPVLGRFLSPDPIVSRPDLSQRWNRYSYVMNSPLSLIDPMGFDERVPHDWEPPDIDLPGSGHPGDELRYMLIPGMALSAGGGWGVVAEVQSRPTGEGEALARGFREEATRQSGIHTGASMSSTDDPLEHILEIARNRPKAPYEDWDTFSSLIDSCLGDSFCSRALNDTANGVYTGSIYYWEGSNRVDIDDAVNWGFSSFALALKMFTASEGYAGGAWLGLNNKWYRPEHRPNGATGSRNRVLDSTRRLRLAGRGTQLFVGGMILGDVYSAAQRGDRAGIAYSSVSGAVLGYGALGGPPGWALSGGYTFVQILTWPLWIDD